MNGKVGIGIITYNAPEKIIQSAFSVPSTCVNFVIVNDGSKYDQSCYPEHAHIIQHEKNCGVSKSKNDALRFLLDRGCEHLFIMEDDVIIKDPGVFDRYIEVSKKTGILHLNYALQGPFNFKNTPKTKSSKGDLTDRFFDESNSEPAPLCTVDYDNGVEVSFYPACVGAFSYFRRSVIEQSGFFDEEFKNSWEHVEHTYRIIKSGFHTPFGWFADIANSNKYLINIPNCMENSTIAKDPLWKNNSEKGEKYFKSIHGYTPGKIPKTSKKDLFNSAKDLYNKRDLNLLIKFPTRGRKSKFFEVLEKYISYISDKENYKVVVSCDLDDTTMNTPEVIAEIKKYPNVEIYFGNNKSKIEAVNNDLANQKDFDIILLASDDMIPEEKGFDLVIKNNMLKYFPDLDGVLWFNDGYQGSTLNTLCILGKKYYHRFNYIYHPAYKSLWCDNEFTGVSKKLKKQVYIDKIIIKHEHPASNADIKEDQLYEINLKLNSIDRSTYEKREKVNFEMSRANLFYNNFNALLKRLTKSHSGNPNISDI
jgi:hypothetical protein